MGSSSDDDYDQPPYQPVQPPAGMIMPVGRSTPYQPNFINFLGDPSVPNTGLTPDMLSQINGMNGPQLLSPPPQGTSPPAPEVLGAASMSRKQLDDLKRQQLAKAMQKAGVKSKRQWDPIDSGYGGRGRADAPGRA